MLGLLDLHVLVLFSLLLKMAFCRFVKAGSSSFCCRDDLVLALSMWR